MRSLIGSVLVICGCATAPAPEAPSPRTVRERLIEPTRLVVSAPQSAGAITARRYTHDGWLEGTTAIAIDNGELDASVAPSGALDVATLAVSPQPIDIPADVFGQPAQLRDVRLAVVGAPKLETTWSDDNHATATATVNLDLSWSIATGAGVTPLGMQRLHSIPIEIVLTGDGDVVDAAIGAHAEGEVWSWADIVQLANLQLTLAAATSNP